MTGVATFGALALWAASCGNLAGYVLVAKFVSLLSTLGISISGGTAAVTSAVASIGGPVVLGIALAVIAAIGAFAIFSGAWRKNVAKKMIDSYRDNKILRNLQNSMNTYWDNSQTAFTAAADNLDAEWVKHIDELRKQLNSYDVDAITKARNEAEALRNFLQNIPF